MIKLSVVTTLTINNEGDLMRNNDIEDRISENIKFLGVIMTFSTVFYHCGGYDIGGR